MRFELLQDCSVSVFVYEFSVFVISLAISKSCWFVLFFDEFLLLSLA